MKFHKYQALGNDYIVAKDAGPARKVAEGELASELLDEEYNVKERVS